MWFSVLLKTNILGYQDQLNIHHYFTSAVQKLIELDYKFLKVQEMAQGLKIMLLKEGCM